MTKNSKDYKPTPVYIRRLVRGILKKVNVDKNGYHRVNKLMHIDFEHFHKHREYDPEKEKTLKGKFTKKRRKYA